MRPFKFNLASLAFIATLPSAIGFQVAGNRRNELVRHYRIPTSRSMALTYLYPYRTLEHLALIGSHAQMMLNSSVAGLKCLSIGQILHLA